MTPDQWTAILPVNSPVVLAACPSALGGHSRELSGMRGRVLGWDGEMVLVRFSNGRELWVGAGHLQTIPETYVNGVAK